MEFSSDIMESPEYKQLYASAKSQYPHEYDYILQIACVSYLMETQCNIKSNINIEIAEINEVQEEHNN